MTMSAAPLDLNWLEITFSSLTCRRNFRNTIIKYMLLKRNWLNRKPKKIRRKRKLKVKRKKKRKKKKRLRRSKLGRKLRKGRKKKPIRNLKNSQAISTLL